MTTMTKADRREIAILVAKHRFGLEKEKHFKAENAVALKVYEHIHKGFLDKMKEFPREAFNAAITLHLTVGGQHRSLRLSDALPVFASRNRVAFASNDPLGMEIVEAYANSKGVEDKLYNSINELIGALGNWKTFEKLIKDWPEVKPFADGVLGTKLGRTISTLPAVMVSTLNKEFNLPPE